MRRTSSNNNRRMTLGPVSDTRVNSKKKTTRNSAGPGGGLDAAEAGERGPAGAGQHAGAAAGHSLQRLVSALCHFASQGGAAAARHHRLHERSHQRHGRDASAQGGVSVVSLFYLVVSCLMA